MLQNFCALYPLSFFVIIDCEHLMRFCVMMQTSFDANLVRAERSDVGVAISLALCDREKLFRILVS